MKKEKISILKKHINNKKEKKSDKKHEDMLRFFGSKGGYDRRYRGSPEWEHFGE
ncbi:hypothetical protein KAW18_03725 [candidate division WOR-3 bacterium]|nr:hypothetical protein [Candidatus Parcubacteria bacterium]MCK4526456.1 hypothetical protein [candidate division WOR-3 bacterium]